MSFRGNFSDVGKMMTFFLEIDPTLGYISEIVGQRDGDPRIQNHMQLSARLLTYAMWPSAPLLLYANWPPEAHEFDTIAVYDFPRENVVQ